MGTNSLPREEPDVRFADPKVRSMEGDTRSVRLLLARTKTVRHKLKALDQAPSSHLDEESFPARSRSDYQQLGEHKDWRDPIGNTSTQSKSFMKPTWAFLRHRNGRSSNRKTSAFKMEHSPWKTCSPTPAHLGRAKIVRAKVTARASARFLRVGRVPDGEPYSAGTLSDAKSGSYCRPTKWTARVAP